MNKNDNNITQVGTQDNDVGIAALIFGVTSLFFFAQLFVPLALLCGIIGFMMSQMLFSTFWLAITGSNIDNKIASSDSITPQTYSQASVTPASEESFFHAVTIKVSSVLDNINCQLVAMDISTRQPCSHPVATAQNPTPIAQTQLVPEFISLLQTYSTKAEKKAIALAQDSHRRAAWGYSFNYATQTQANDRALLECRNYLAKYKVETDCKLYSIGDQVVWGIAN